MDARGLCQIQARLGHDYLPEICQRYPRIELQELFRRVESANLSCPEINRLVMETSKLDSFFSDNGVIPAFQMGDALDLDLASSLNKFVQQVLCDARFGNQIRLLAIANVLCELVTASQQGLLDSARLKRIFTKPRQQLYELNQKVKSRRIKVDPDIGGRFWLIIYNWSKSFGQAGLPDEFRQLDLVQQAENAEDNDAFYRYFYQSILSGKASSQQAMGQAGDYGAKYFLVKFANSGFPVNPLLGNFVASFLYCVYPYALMQLYLRLIVSEKGRLELTDVNRVIYRVERWLDHNTRIYAALNTNPMFLRLDLYKECLLDC